MIDLSRRLLQGVVRTWLKTALDPARPVSGQRKMIATAARLLPPPGRVRSVNQLPGGLPGVRIDPPSSDDRRGAILYLHGGGYVLGSPATHRNIAARLSWLTGLPVFLPKYRLAPEARWPAAREDACAAWRGLIESDFDADQSVIAGDSAGGGLAVAVAQQAAAEGYGLPAALVCFSPWVDLGLGGATIESLAGVDPMLTPRWLAWAARTYLGGHPACAPTASPLFGDMRGLPPTLVQAAGREVLLDDAIRLAEAIRAAGGTVSLQIEPHLWHAWQLFAGLLPAADKALLRTVAFIDETLSAASAPARKVAQ